MGPMGSSFCIALALYALRCCAQGDPVVDSSTLSGVKESRYLNLLHPLARPFRPRLRLAAMNP